MCFLGYILRVTPITSKLSSCPKYRMSHFLESERSVKSSLPYPPGWNPLHRHRLISMTESEWRWSGRDMLEILIPTILCVCFVLHLLVEVPPRPIYGIGPLECVLVVRALILSSLLLSFSKYLFSSPFSFRWVISYLCSRKSNPWLTCSLSTISLFSIHPSRVSII